MKTATHNTNGNSGNDEQVLPITTVLSMIDYSAHTGEYFALTYQKLDGSPPITRHYTKHVKSSPTSRGKPQLKAATPKGAGSSGNTHARTRFYSIKYNRVLLLKEKDSTRPTSIKYDLITKYNGYRIDHRQQ